MVQTLLARSTFKSRLLAWAGGRLDCGGRIFSSKTPKTSIQIYREAKKPHTKAQRHRLNSQSEQLACKTLAPYALANPVTFTVPTFRSAARKVILIFPSSLVVKPPVRGLLAEKSIQTVKSKFAATVMEVQVLYAAGPFNISTYTVQSPWVSLTGR